MYWQQRNIFYFLFVWNTIEEQTTRQKHGQKHTTKYVAKNFLLTTRINKDSFVC